MSFSKIVYVFLSVCLVFTWAGSQPLGKLPADLGFLSFMSNSRVNLQANPDQSIECFNYYIPKINDIAQNYSTDLSKCVDTSGVAQKAAEDATLEQRSALVHSVNASCEVLNKCRESATVSDIFQCYINEVRISWYFLKWKNLIFYFFFRVPNKPRRYMVSRQMPPCNCQI